MNSWLKSCSKEGGERNINRAQLMLKRGGLESLGGVLREIDREKLRAENIRSRKVEGRECDKAKIERGLVGLSQKL